MDVKGTQIKRKRTHLSLFGFARVGVTTLFNLARDPEDVRGRLQLRARLAPCVDDQDTLFLRLQL